jgi:hypothetical protein
VEPLKIFFAIDPKLTVALETLATSPVPENSFVCLPPREKFAAAAAALSIRSHGLIIMEMS